MITITGVVMLLMVVVMTLLTVMGVLWEQR